MKHEIILKKEHENSNKIGVCIDGTWYPSLAKIPELSYMSIYSFRQKYDLTTEEAIDRLLTFHEERAERRRIREEKAKEQPAAKFVYHGEGFPSFSQCIRVIAHRRKLTIPIQRVLNYISNNKITDKEAGFDAFLEKFY